MRRLALAAILSMSAACSRSAATSAPALSDPRRPPTQAELPTTDGRVAWENLDFQIKSLEKRPFDAADRAKLVEVLLMHGRYSSRVADYEHALELAEEAVEKAPKDCGALLARASARSSLHLFPLARADLASAEKLAAPTSDLRRARAAIAQAEGALDEALRVRRAESTVSPDITNLGAEAALLGAMGKTEEALKTFDRALKRYHDVSPFPVAWVLFQEANVLERAGRSAQAKAFYQAARERLPAYAHATSHVATLEAAAAGVDLLTPVVESADDPELEALLAETLRKKGDLAAADDHRARAQARYERLLADHPEAFADHAGWFFLNQLGDGRRALTLAKENLTRRKDESAYELAILAALSAGERGDACDYGKQAAAIPWITPMIKHAADGACEGR